MDNREDAADVAGLKEYSGSCNVRCILLFISGAIV